MHEKSPQMGFTLIELMIVVAIIAIISAIAIPNLLQSRIQSNEAAAIGNLRAICSAQSAYNAANFVFATDFDELQGPTPPFLSGEWGEAPKSGYAYSLDGSTVLNFNARAEPVEHQVTGRRYFYTDASAVIRFSTDGPADETGQPLWETGGGGG